MFLRNSNAMDFILDNDKVSFKIVGGIIDMIFFIGQKSPEKVV